MQVYPQTVGKPSWPNGASKSVMARSHIDGANFLMTSGDLGFSVSAFVEEVFVVGLLVERGLLF
jgi:hypothetical protein